MLNIVAVTTLIGLELIARAGAPQADSIQASAKRFFMPGAQQTLIEGFATVPFNRLTALTVGSDSSRAMYRFEIAIRDRDGLTLTTDSWTGEVPATMLAVAGAGTVEHFQFAVPNGEYSVLITVKDSASGAEELQRVDLIAFEERPLASDLLLAASMRRSIGEGDTPQPGEIQKGALFLSASPLPSLTPANAQLYHYLELYPGSPGTFTYVTHVLRPDGSTVISSPEQQLEVGEAGGILARGLNLAGLPEGSYVFRIDLEGPGGAVSRSAGFRMGGLTTLAAGSEIGRGATARNPFADLTEAALDSLYEPIVYLQNEDERGIYHSLSVEGKRNYLNAFWSSRDQVPATPENEYMRTYYEAIAIANRDFKEGGAADVPGWRTDRGRIFLKYGRPDEFLNRPSYGQNSPYIVWKYTQQGRPVKFLFIDETGFGNYNLVFTNDRTEFSRGDWQSLMDQDGIQDVERF